MVYLQQIEMLAKLSGFFSVYLTYVKCENRIKMEVKYYEYTDSKGKIRFNVFVMVFILKFFRNSRFFFEILFRNLSLIPADKMLILSPLREGDRKILMEGLDGIISKTLQDKIWNMIWKRWCAYENFCNSR